MTFCTDASGNPIPCPEDGEESETSRRGLKVLLPDLSSGFYSAGRGGFSATKEYSVQQASAYLLRMNASEQRRLRGYYEKIKDRWGFRSERSMWNMFVVASAETGETPWQLMEAASSGSIKPPEDSGGSGGPFRNVYVDLTSETVARRLVDDTLGSYLGRRATEKEAAAFYETLTKAQRNNPTVVQGYAGEGGQSSVKTNTVDQQQLARDFARTRSDYAETTTQTTVKSLIERAIREADQDWVA